LAEKHSADSGDLHPHLMKCAKEDLKGPQGCWKEVLKDDEVKEELFGSILDANRAASLRG